jgi:hypothetical protein
MWILDRLEAISQSSYFGTLISAAFGAFAGAYATSRRETKRAVIAELNSIAAARMLAFSICNKFLSLKSQHVAPIYEDYQEGRRKFIEVRNAFAAGDHTRTAEYAANLRNITPMWLPTESLERQIIEKISIRGRGLAAAIDLISAVDGLTRTIDTRNELVSACYRAPQPVTPGDRLEFALKYFGVANSRGIIDESFSSNVEGLYRQTDDCIFFSKTLADDLFEYERRVRRRYIWRFHLGVPRLVREKWEFPEMLNLLPKESDYAKWLRGFPKHPTRLRQFRAWVASCFMHDDAKKGSAVR